jgi:SHS2 domain-containing protein
MIAHKRDATISHKSWGVTEMVYEYLDHKSDVYVHTKSETLAGIFEDATKATFEVMLSTSAVMDTSVVEASLNADDFEQLLYMWVDHLLYLFDAEGFAVSRAEVAIGDTGGPASLQAKLYGEAYDPKRHGQRVAVKAMTYSLMRISKTGAAWEAYFVLDI